MATRGRKPKVKKVEEVPVEAEVTTTSTDVPVDMGTPADEVVVEVSVELVPEVEVVEEAVAPAPEVEVIAEPTADPDGLVTVFIPGIGTRRGKVILVSKKEHVEIKDPTHTFLVHKSPIGDHYEV